MSELTLKLQGKTAERLRELVAQQRYARPEDAIADALEALEASCNPELDAWLRDTIVERAAATTADPGRAMTGAQVRERLKRNE